MKTLKDLTPEIIKKIPSYKERCLEGISDGQRFENFNLKDAEEAVNWNYKKCCYRKPVVIVAENPLETQLLFNYIKYSEKFNIILYYLYCLKNNIEFQENKLDSKLHSKLYTQLNGQLNSQLNYQLNSQLNYQLESQLLNQLDSQLHDQLWYQLRSQLRSQLESQLRSQLYIQLRSLLLSQLHSQLNSQLWSQLGSQLWSQLGSQLESQLRSQLDSQLGSQLWNQFNHRLSSQLRSQLRNYNNSYLFTLDIYSNCYYTWYKFIKEEFNLPLTIEKDFEKCFYLQRKSGIYSAIFSELVCVVSKYPKKIYWNNNFQLHNTVGSAIEWNSFSELTKLNCYRINRRIIPNYLFEKEFTKEDFYKETNEEIRAAMYEIKADKIFEFLDCKLVDSQIITHRNGDKEKLELYQTKEKFKEVSNLNNEANQPLCWLKLVCPSTGTGFLIPTDSTFNNALDAAKYHRPLSVPLSLNYSWSSRS
jgi:hypothetical protein